MATATRHLHVPREHVPRFRVASLHLLAADALELEILTTNALYGDTSIDVARSIAAKVNGLSAALDVIGWSDERDATGSFECEPALLAYILEEVEGCPGAPDEPDDPSPAYTDWLADARKAVA